MMTIASLPQSAKPNDVLAVAKESQLEAEKASLRMHRASEYGDLNAYRIARSTYKRACQRANAWHKAWQSLVKSA